MGSRLLQTSKGNPSAESQELWLHSSGILAELQSPEPGTGAGEDSVSTTDDVGTKTARAPGVLAAIPLP